MAEFGQSGRQFVRLRIATIAHRSELSPIAAAGINKLSFDQLRLGNVLNNEGIRPLREVSSVNVTLRAKALHRSFRWLRALRADQWLNDQ